MTLTVNGQPAEPGCYVEGHWGQYGPDHFADQLEGFGIDIPKGIDPRRYRRIAEWCERRSIHGQPLHGPLANVWLTCLENAAYEVEDRANSLTEGGYWEWTDGECFLRSYVCPECGRDATTGRQSLSGLNPVGMRVKPCDYCCDADDPGCFA